jgi:hypothetical protein
MGKAPWAPSTVVHDCKPLPHGKTASLNDGFETVLFETVLFETVLPKFCPAGAVGLADGWALDNF